MIGSSLSFLVVTTQLGQIVNASTILFYNDNLHYRRMGSVEQVWGLQCRSSKGTKSQKRGGGPQPVATSRANLLGSLDLQFIALCIGCWDHREGLGDMRD